MNLINNLYYSVKPLLPRWLQLQLRKKVIDIKRKSVSDIWPILESAGYSPMNWVGWPMDKKFSVVLTHDVESQIGHDRCFRVLELEKNLGFKSSFNFVPERYRVSADLRKTIESEGFEVGIHGLNHDGKLFKNKKTFVKRAEKINQYIREWNVAGFRSPAMHHNLQWIHELDIQYDLSTFDTDPFEPQSDGVGTIFPFWVSENQGENGYVEMPYTLAQDFTPYVLMQEKEIDIWKVKIDWIVRKGGMVLVNTHPDYFGFDEKLGLEEFPAQFYVELLEYIKNNYQDQYWMALPHEMATFWKSKMHDGRNLDVQG